MVSVFNKQSTDRRLDVSSMLVKRLLLIFKEGFSYCVKLIPVCFSFVVCVVEKKNCLGQLLKSFYKFLVLTVGHLISYNSCDMHVSSRSNGQMPL